MSFPSIFLDITFSALAASKNFKIQRLFFNLWYSHVPRKKVFWALEQEISFPVSYLKNNFTSECSLRVKLCWYQGNWVEKYLLISFLLMFIFLIWPKEEKVFSFNQILIALFFLLCLTSMISNSIFPFIPFCLILVVTLRSWALKEH